MAFCCCAQNSNILIPLYKRYIIKLRKGEMTRKRQENKRKLLFNFLTTIRGSTEFSGMMFSVLYTHAVFHKFKENGKWKTTRVMGTLFVYNCHFLHHSLFLFTLVYHAFSLNSPLPHFQLSVFQLNAYKSYFFSHPLWVAHWVICEPFFDDFILSSLISFSSSLLHQYSNIVSFPSSPKLPQ